MPAAGLASASIRVIQRPHTKINIVLCIWTLYNEIQIESMFSLQKSTQDQMDGWLIFWNADAKAGALSGVERARDGPVRLPLPGGDLRKCQIIVKGVNSKECVLFCQADSALEALEFYAGGPEISEYICKTTVIISDGAICGKVCFSQLMQSKA